MKRSGFLVLAGAIGVGTALSGNSHTAAAQACSIGAVQGWPTLFRAVCHKRTGTAYGPCRPTLYCPDTTGLRRKLQGDL